MMTCELCDDYIMYLMSVYDVYMFSPREHERLFRFPCFHHMRDTGLCSQHTLHTHSYYDCSIDAVSMCDCFVYYALINMLIVHSELSF